MASSSTPHYDLSDSNSRVQLSLPRSSDSPLLVGSTLRPTLLCKEDVEYTSISLRLVGETKATIMGKERWQAGAVMNATLGGGAMGPAGMPITSVERLPFLDLEIPLVSSPTAEQDSKVSEKARNSDDSYPMTVKAGSRFVFEFVLPPAPDGQLLPAVAPREFDMTSFSVTWTLKFTGTRKGVFRRNDSLSLDLPVVFPSPSPTLATTVVSTHPFKFDTGPSGGMTLRAELSVAPIRHRSAFDFTLTLSPSSPAASHLLTDSASPLKVNASLSRHTRTSPIANPNSGRPFEWAGVRICAVDMKRAKDDDWKWHGKIKQPEGECSVDSKGVTISHNLNCHVISPNLAQAALHISLPVFLPSSPFESTVPSSSEGVHERDSDLPAYVA